MLFPVLTFCLFDFFPQAAKMAKYIKAQRLCDVLFAIFGIVWFITRLVLYPTKYVSVTVFCISCFNIWKHYHDYVFKKNALCLKDKV